MNTIDHLCRYFTSWMLPSLDVVAVNSKFACTLMTMRIIQCMIFSFAFSNIRSVCQQNIAVVSSLGFSVIPSWHLAS